MALWNQEKQRGGLKERFFYAVLGGCLCVGPMICYTFWQMFFPLRSVEPIQVITMTQQKSKLQIVPRNESEMRRSLTLLPVQPRAVATTPAEVVVPPPAQVVFPVATPEPIATLPVEQERPPIALPTPTPGPSHVTPERKPPAPDPGKKKKEPEPGPIIRVPDIPSVPDPLFIADPTVPPIPTIVVPER